jgi:hypothetical protein
MRLFLPANRIGIREVKSGCPLGAAVFLGGQLIAGPAGLLIHAAVIQDEVEGCAVGYVHVDSGWNRQIVDILILHLHVYLLRLIGLNSRRLEPGKEAFDQHALVGGLEGRGDFDDHGGADDIEVLQDEAVVDEFGHRGAVHIGTKAVAFFSVCNLQTC